MVGRNMEVRVVAQPDWQSGEAGVTLFTDTPSGTVHFTDKVEVIKKTAIQTTGAPRLIRGVAL